MVTHHARASSLPTPFSQPCPAMCNSPVALLSEVIFFHFTRYFLLLSPESCSTQQAACQTALVSQPEHRTPSQGKPEQKKTSRHLVQGEEGTLPHSRVCRLAKGPLAKGKTSCFAQQCLWHHQHPPTCFQTKASDAALLRRHTQGSISEGAVGSSSSSLWHAPAVSGELQPGQLRRPVQVWQAEFFPILSP